MERLKNHSEFVGVLRLRKRVSSADVVAHYALNHQRNRYMKPLSHNQENKAQDRAAQGKNPNDDNRLGLAVSKAVGNAVIRNKVKRRFRVLARRYEAYLPVGCDVILRAKPQAGLTSFEDLDPQVEKLFSKIAINAQAISQPKLSERN